MELRAGGLQCNDDTFESRILAQGCDQRITSEEAHDLAGIVDHRKFHLRSCQEDIDGVLKACVCRHFEEACLYCIGTLQAGRKVIDFNDLRLGACGPVNEDQ